MQDKIFRIVFPMISELSETSKKNDWNILGKIIGVLSLVSLKNHGTKYLQKSILKE